MKYDALPSHYDPAAAEATYRPQWEAAGYARGNPDAPGTPYSIVMPPPNVTGSLHMGHALNSTLQDVLIRYRRMAGDNVVCIPGLDHASIAVHWLIERKLRAEGKSRQDIGRKAFMELAWAFKKESEDAIVAQQKRLGVSCDWDRLCFTLDDGPSKGVQAAFVRLYEDGLIYRAERLVNWDPVTQTSVSDLEVVHDENVKSELYQFAYPLSDGSGELVVATTRPETMLGDTAVAVHPKDERYSHLIGQTVRHPLVDRAIPIIADGILVDPAFGTGAVKVTPAHDFNDFAVGQRHDLEIINLLNKDGTFNAHAGPFAGLDVPTARKQVKERLEALGLERGSEVHTMSVGRSERSGAILEPMISTQWYVRAKPLATPAMAAIQNKFSQFVPQAWENTYFSWLRDIRDWCISRQLWWGHRIPAYFCASCEHVHVALVAPDACEKCAHPHLNQDNDVLDTWFSSALWPFSTQGWPERTPELKAWFPTQVVVTSFDIIFFWVARMMMFSLYFTGSVPFKDIYIHALIRDAKGEKMSKTKGNVVNPLAMIDTYGLDAFRYTLVAFAGQGRDVRWDESRAAGYQKFLNKIWQAFRFTAAQLPEDTLVPPLAEVTLNVFDQWILTRLNVCVTKTRAALDQYKFNEAAAAIYAFVWDELCDWYLEIAKTTLYDDAAAAADKHAARRVLLDVFGTVARLLHPISPYLGEELYQRLRERDPMSPTHGRQAEASIMVAPYPTVQDHTAYEMAVREADFVAQTVVAVRRLRAEYNVPVKEQVTLYVRGSVTMQQWLQNHARVLAIMAKAQVKVHTEGELPAKAGLEVVQGCELCMPLEGLIDFAAEAARMDKELMRCDKDADKINAQLGRPDFLARAPQEIVADKNQQLAAIQERRARLMAAAERLRRV
jgi:valyl-tRNA synthetase